MTNLLVHADSLTTQTPQMDSTSPIPPAETTTSALLTTNDMFSGPCFGDPSPPNSSSMSIEDDLSLSPSPLALGKIGIFTMQHEPCRHTVPEQHHDIINPHDLQPEGLPEIEESVSTETTNNSGVPENFALFYETCRTQAEPRDELEDAESQAFLIDHGPMQLSDNDDNLPLHNPNDEFEMSPLLPFSQQIDKNSTEILLQNANDIFSALSGISSEFHYDPDSKPSSQNSNTTSQSLNMMKPDISSSPPTSSPPTVFSSSPFASSQSSECDRSDKFTPTTRQTYNDSEMVVEESEHLQSPHQEPTWLLVGEDLDRGIELAMENPPALSMLSKPSHIADPIGSTFLFSSERATPQEVEGGVDSRETPDYASSPATSSPRLLSLDQEPRLYPVILPLVFDAPSSPAFRPNLLLGGLEPLESGRSLDVTTSPKPLSLSLDIDCAEVSSELPSSLTPTSSPLPRSSPPDQCFSSPQQQEEYHIGTNHNQASSSDFIASLPSVDTSTDTPTLTEINSAQGAEVLGAGATDFPLESQLQIFLGKRKADEDSNNIFQPPSVEKESHEAPFVKPSLPNPKRPTIASQKLQHKKLATPFRSPVLKRPKLDHQPLNDLPTPPVSRPVSFEKSNSPPNLLIPETSDVKKKHRTQRAAAQFKSPLSTEVSSKLVSSIRMTPTIQALERKLQILKRAVKVKQDGDEGVLETLVKKWTDAGREVAWEVWELVKENASTEDQAWGRAKRNPAKRAFEDAWGWSGKGDDKKQNVNNTERNWGWDVEANARDDRISDEMAIEDSEEDARAGRRELEDKDDEDEERRQDTLGTMLMQLGIALETLGWNEEEGVFQGE